MTPKLKNRVVAVNDDILFDDSSILDELEEESSSFSGDLSPEESAFPRMGGVFSVEEVENLDVFEDLEKLDAMETLLYDPAAPLDPLRDSGELPSLSRVATLEEGTDTLLRSTSFFPEEEGISVDNLPFEEVESVKTESPLEAHPFFEWSKEQELSSILMVREPSQQWRAIQWSEEAVRGEEKLFAGLLRESETAMKAMGAGEKVFTTVFIVNDQAWVLLREGNLLMLTKTSLHQLGFTLSKARNFLAA